MTARLRSAIVLLLVSFFAPAVLAGKLADLPWDDKIPQEIRSAVRYALERETSDLSKATNAAGKKFVRVIPSGIVEPQADGSAVSSVTIQRCLADRMVTERWRYTLQKKGLDYEIIAREKIAESDDAAIVRFETPDQGRPLSSAEFKHDLYDLQLDSGAYILGFTGDRPNKLMIAGSGRLRVQPVSDYEAMFFERRLHRKSIDSAVSLVTIDFHPDDTRFLDLVRWTPQAKAGGAPAAPGLREVRDEQMKPYEGQEFTPYMYDPPRRPIDKGIFTIRAKTADHGWVVYDFDPNRVKQVGLALEKGGLSLRSDDKTASELISVYNLAEIRALPMAAQERRPYDVRWVRPIRYDAQFDIGADKFSAIVDVQCNVMIASKDLWFFLGGNPTVRYVRLSGADLVFVPFPNKSSTTFGFEETNNAFRVVLPEETPAGTELRLQIAFDSPKLVQMYDEGFWWIQRGGFLPFASGGISDPAYMRVVMRTPERYTHIGLGVKLGEEIVRGDRITEWGAERTFNFATMLIGRYYPPIEREWNGVKITGYQTRSQDENELTNQHLEPHVEEAVESMAMLTKLFGTPYPFKELKIVGTPGQWNYSQSPSSIIYVGQIWMLSEAVIANYMRSSPGGMRGSTAHEMTHQWFGGQVDSVGDQYWFVESFCEVASAFFRQAIGDKAGLKVKLDDWRTDALSVDWQCAVKDFYRAENAAGARMYYTKGPLVLWMLREYFGERELLQFMRNIVQVYGGDLISTSDLQLVAEKTFGQKMDWFFDQYIRDVGIPEVHYRFDSPRPAEDGQGWIITGKLTQQIMVKGAPAPGKVFKNLLVPITVPTASGPQKIKEFMDSPEKDVRIRVEAKPTGALKVNDGNVVYMTTKEL